MIVRRLIIIIWFSLSISACMTVEDQQRELEMQKMWEDMRK